MKNKRELVKFQINSETTCNVLTKKVIESLQMMDEMNTNSKVNIKVYNGEKSETTG